MTARSEAITTVDWSEHVHTVLSRAGLKRGGARERVIALLAREPCALTAVEIEDALRDSGRPTGRASGGSHRNGCASGIIVQGSTAFTLGYCIRGGLQCALSGADRTRLI